MAAGVQGPIGTRAHRATKRTHTAATVGASREHRCQRSTAVPASIPTRQGRGTARGRGLTAIAGKGDGSRDGGKRTTPKALTAFSHPRSPKSRFTQCCRVRRRLFMRADLVRTAVTTGKLPQGVSAITARKGATCPGIHQGEGPRRLSCHMITCTPCAIARGAFLS